MTFSLKSKAATKEESAVSIFASTFQTETEIHLSDNDHIFIHRTQASSFRGNCLLALTKRRVVVLPAIRKHVDFVRSVPLIVSV